MKLLLPIILLFFVVSCKSGDKCEDCDLPKQQDSTAVVQDDLEAAISKDTAVAVSKEQVEIHAKIVKKYGEQWDFCKCVVANDSITDAFEKKLTSEQEEKLMARWDYVDKKCKELITNPNTTPEERAKHDKKVMNCLKQNGLKK